MKGNTHVTVKFSVQNVFDEGQKVIVMARSQTIVDPDELKSALKNDARYINKKIRNGTLPTRVNDS